MLENQSKLQAFRAILCRFMLFAMFMAITPTAAMAVTYGGSFLNIDGHFYLVGADQNQNLFLFWDMGPQYVMIADGALLSSCTNIAYSPQGGLSFSYAGGYYIGPLDSLRYNIYTDESRYVIVLSIDTVAENFSCSPEQNVPSQYDNLFANGFN